MRILISIFLLMCMFLMYVWVENKMLIVRHYKIKDRRMSGKKIKIVHISDVHKKKYPHNWKKIVLPVKRINPDLILITGDLISRNETDFEYTRKLVERLCDTAPVYCSIGNHEIDLDNDKKNEYRSMLAEAGAVLLENTKIRFEKDDVELNIYGAVLKKSIYKNKNGGYSDLERYTANELEELFGKPEGISLLMAHNPFFFDEYSEWGADITFSGHVHGGIINTPFGGLLSPERKFFPKYTKGIYECNGKKMAVSAGIGKLRLFNPSEILCLTLE